MCVCVCVCVFDIVKKNRNFVNIALRCERHCFTTRQRSFDVSVVFLLKLLKYRSWLPLISSIQMKCQGGNKYALSITVKFDQSTRRFGRISFAPFFKLTKHIALLFHLLSPYLLSCMRGLRNVRKMYIVKTIMKFCVHWSTVCGKTNSDTGGI